jgi:hypothetical protein
MPDYNITSVVNTPSDQIVTKDFIIANFGPAIGEIYVADGSTTQSFPTGTTYTKLTAFTTNGASINCTADATNDKITITKAGYYLVNCVVSGYDGATGAEFKMALFKNGVEQENIHATNKYNAGSEIDNMEMCGIISVIATDYVDVRLRHGSGGSVNFTTQYANLTITFQPNNIVI